MQKKKGLDSLNPLGRTDTTLKQDIKHSLRWTYLRNTFKNIYFLILVRTFLTKLEYIFFCHYPEGLGECPIGQKKMYGIR